MSYYKPSFSQTVAMSRGSGRGFSSPRGNSSYRGSSGRGSAWGDRGNNRGGFSSNRGGGRFSSSWNSGNASSFDSRSRYPSSGGGGSGDRYGSNSRNRADESSYRRSYRSDANNYSSRDASSHRSPDRKRMRNEGTYSERRSFGDDRRPVFRGRDDYRKPVSMPSGASSVRQSPRGGYRGRAGPRGNRGSRLSLRDGAIRRRVVDGGYLRKRGAPLRSTSEYLRRLKLSRLRSLATRRALKSRNEKSKSTEKEESEKEETTWENEEKDGEKKEDEEKSGEEKKSTPTKKSPKKDKEKGKDESDKEDKKSGSEDEDRPRSRYTGRPFIRLTCTHCGMKSVTFKEYSNHLFNSRHVSAMRKIAIKQKSTLARMRLAQRNAQRELEKTDDSLASRTNFCPLCKLNYRQLKSKHQMSEAHRNMKKFLMPFCRTCHITFKSPMLYENHMCSLEHIKRKAQTDMLNGDKHGSDKEPASPTEEDLENFMTLDSVGDVDEEDVEGKIPKSSIEEGGEAAAERKVKESINVGVEHVKKVEVHYCDLCRIYLSRYDSPERAIKQHCRGRMHLQRYVRYKEDKDLRRQAERMHRKSQEAKEAKEKEKDKKEDKTDGDKDSEDKKKDDKNEEDGGEDKMWEDVDKDLGEILAEVNTEGGNKSSDEDEDSRPDGERYDRFRYSEKGGDAKDGKKEDPDADGDADEDKDDGEENDNDDDKDGNNEDDENKNDDEEEEEEEKETESASGK